MTLPGVGKDLVLSRAENCMFVSEVRKKIWSCRDSPCRKKYLVMSEIGKSFGPIRAWKKFGHVGGQKKDSNMSYATEGFDLVRDSTKYWLR